MYELPDIVKEINKKAKATKITTLDKALALVMRRFFSGSLTIDDMIGGGYAYKRILMLFGARSCIDGDSSLLYEVWKGDKRVNSKGGSIRRLYERFTGDISEGSKYGRHLQHTNVEYYVKSVDENGVVFKNRILDVVKTGKKECYAVTVSTGEQLISTMEHKYLTPTGYKKLSELKPGDILYVNRNNREGYRNSYPTKPTHRPTLCVKYHPHYPIKIVREKYNGKERDYIYHRTQISRIAYEAFLNDMTYEEYVNFLNTKSKDEINNLTFIPKNIHVHHKDENYLNNDIDNLELIDPISHGKLHGKNTKKSILITVEESIINAIEYVGARDTFDIKCPYPYNNYIANGIVVHNSGKNALLNQMIAYNQRICRHCFNILPEFYGIIPPDRWTTLLMAFGIEECTCGNPTGKNILVYDFEKSYSVEPSKMVEVIKFTRKDTGEEVDGLDVNTLREELAELKLLEQLDDEQKKRAKEIEKFLKHIVEENTRILQMSTMDYLSKCGVLVNRLLVGDPADTEEGIDSAREVIRSGEVDAIIWDSLQAAVPRYVKDRDADQDTMGVEAKKNGLLMRHICSAYAAQDLENERDAYRPAFFITSQVRSKLGGFVAGPDGPSGGHAVHHHASLELEIKREYFLRQNGAKAEFGGEPWGQKIRLRTEKSKLNAPSGMYEIDYYFKDGAVAPIGVDHTAEIVALGVRSGVIERAGAWYTVTGDKSKQFQGEVALVDFFRSNPDEVGRIFNLIKNRV